MLDNAIDALMEAVYDYSWVNPHLSIQIRVNRNGREGKLSCPASDMSWTKWLPKNPTSAHWYDVSRMQNLIAKTIAHTEDNGEPCPTLFSFLNEFDSLASTQKRSEMCAAIGMSRSPLSDLINTPAITKDNVALLLTAMQHYSRTIKPRSLGVIGEEVLRERFEGHTDADMETFRYKKIEVLDSSLPFIIEAAFAECNGAGHGLVTGLNWSITVGQQPFRNVGGNGLDGLLSDQYAGFDEDVVVFLHVASPRFDFLDKGKSSVSLPAAADEAVVKAITFVTDRWAKQRKREERDASARARRHASLTGKDQNVAIKDAAYEIMTACYMRVSDKGTLPANARQIMYAARKIILNRPDIDKASFSDSYFTQGILVDYMSEHPEECASWNVVWSDRGHLTEPHTGERIGLGTLAIREYVGSYSEPEFNEAGFKEAEIKTHGPNGRYCGLFYVEKEGFDPLIEASQIAERLDLAFFSCKGMSVTAARELVDRTCAEHNLPLFIMHDFDVSGFSIKTTLHTSNRRYKVKTEGQFPVYDIGLRLEDIEYFEEQGEPLESEPFYFNVSDKNPDRAKNRAGKT